MLIYCPEQVSGVLTFTATVANAPLTGATFEFFYQGVLQSDLSGTGTIPTGGQATFAFTAPATEGDSLTTTSVTGTTLTPLS